MLHRNHATTHTRRASDRRSRTAHRPGQDRGERALHLPSSGPRRGRGGGHQGHVRQPARWPARCWRAGPRHWRIRACRTSSACARPGLDVPMWLLRAPTPATAADTVRLADVSLNSEVETVRALDAAAAAAGRRHGIVLMIDLGDLREGIMPRELDELPGCHARARATSTWWAWAPTSPATAPSSPRRTTWGGWWSWPPAPRSARAGRCWFPAATPAAWTWHSTRACRRASPTCASGRASCWG